MNANRVSSQGEDDFSIMIDVEIGLIGVSGKAALIEKLAIESLDSNLETADLFEAIRCIAVVMQQEARKGRVRLTRLALGRGLLRAAEVAS